MRILLVRALALVLAPVVGCEKISQRAAAAAAAKETATAVPLAMLPRALAPTRYQLLLTIDPSGSRSAATRIST
jgi:hypothetical protein